MSILLKKVLFSAALIVLGLVLLVIGTSTLHAARTYIETDAVITSITYEDNVGGDDRRTYHVTVAYTADGVEYEATLGEYRSSFREGKTVRICYNPEKPTEIQSAGYLGTVIFFGLGTASLLIGLWPAVKAIGLNLLARKQERQG